MSTLPPALVAAVKEQRAVLFLGAGASIGSIHPKGEKIPLGDKLRDMICDRFLGGALKNKSLTAVAAMAANEVSLPTLQKYIHDVFSPFGPANFHQLIPTFRWKAITTTNFDLIIERAYEAQKPPLQNLVKTVKDGDQFDTRLQATTNPVGFYKIHGCIEYYSDDQAPLILGQEQYASYTLNRERFYARLKDLAYEYPFIFCGYSIADPHIQQFLFDLTDKRVKRPMYYHVSPDTDDIEARYWATHRVSCINLNLEQFLGELDKSIPALARKLPVGLGGGNLSVKKHYRVASATESETLRSFLTNDAVHVCSSMDYEQQLPGDFYKGYDTGWGAIVQNLDVRRAVCDSVLVDAILLPDEKRKIAELFMLKGPAGNGKTIALKRIAWEAATTYDSLVIFATGPSSLQIQPLQELYELTGKRVLLFCDRVALHRVELLKLLQACRSKDLPITIVGAERDNEWNIYCEYLEPFVRQDFSVTYLSANEISELLLLLERHKALGLLIEKTPQERVDAFLKRAERQLLVALHETTLGVPFEQIVLDEYKRIEPADAKRLYLHICTLHQFGAPVRAGLISRAAGINFDEFGKRFIKPLENVVLIEEDRHSGDVYYRTRHQHVAELVFNQVLSSPEEKFDTFAELLQSINTDYTSDRETFSRLIRGRAVAEMFTSVELGRLLYDRAESISWNDQFVLHQRAVFEMQHPQGVLKLAEDAAARAFDLNPRSHSIRHTQAEIARRQAVNTNDPLRKRVFRRSAKEKLGGELSQLSEYDFYTRARLAIDEFSELAENTSESDNSGVLLEAAKEAETAIQRGLQAYPDSSEILSVEAILRDLLDQGPRARQALERAFTLNPRQDWLAVRLARRNVDENNPDAALRVLNRCLQENPSSKLAHLQMAHLLRQVDGSPQGILEHFRKSFTAGDNHFEGQFWYARELFLQKRGKESESIFTGIHERAPGRFRTNPSAIADDAEGNPIAFIGHLGRKEEGYTFIKSNEFSDAIFGSRSDSESSEWDGLNTGAKVSFHLAFNRRGPRAVKIKAAKS